ncbi:nucleotidyltransferase domain-containing protein [Streptomyces sp. NEAU-H3]|uniref:nucleotidyltransferase domain-containing protein n=1 Tax=Streptomyces sp. NEAU-H3 TaxID=2720636 RepID=UPI00143A9C36|nr:amino acid transporter [Streptomyces sp. NEAU-H3]NJA55919.1 amino acid transporter [Streptomyces sp. NEAU-H3]
MTADDVLALLALLRRAGADVGVEGGWGIDALLGEQTREHQDVDLAYRREDEAAVVAALAADGFAETEDQRPVRHVMTAPDGRAADLHPLAFAADGAAWQESFEPGRPFPYPADCFVEGTIAGAAVPCLSAAQQVFFHAGYEPRPHDVADMERLRRAFGVRTPY